jgi:hypothetical protein
MNAEFEKIWRLKPHAIVVLGFPQNHNGLTTESKPA